MKKIDQTKFGAPDGNCFAACVASILGLEIEDVPEFQWGEDGKVDEDGWWLRFEKWLRERGWSVMMFPINENTDPLPWIPAGIPLLTGGKSPRGNFLHSIVYMSGKVFHDPHPSRAGFVNGVTQDVAAFFPLEPWNLFNISVEK